MNKKTLLDKLKSQGKITKEEYLFLLGEDLKSKVDMEIESSMREDEDGYIRFDADTCVKVMEELDWKWAGENVDVDKFVRALKSYSYEVAKNLLEEIVDKNVNECDYSVESGGIKVEGHLEIIDGKKYIVISPKFILVQDSFEICVDSI
jgi:hypothetical protein